MLFVIDKALDLIQNKQKNGQEYYKIIYYIYISTEPFNTCNEIIDRLNDDGYYMSDKSYFRKKNQPINLLSEILFLRVKNTEEGSGKKYFRALIFERVQKQKRLMGQHLANLVRSRVSGDGKFAIKKNRK